MSQYGMIWTDTGLAKQANAEITGNKVKISQVAVGDGGGAAVTPTQDMTALVNEVWRGGVNLIGIHPDNPNWVKVETKILAQEGGWYVREVAGFDVEGDMVFIGNYAETYKPTLPMGQGLDLYLRLLLATENTSTIELKVDPNVIIASRKWVEEYFENHNIAPDAHEDIRNLIARTRAHAGIDAFYCGMNRV